MKKFSVVLALSLVLGVASLSAGQPYTGEWLFTLSGVNQGGAVLNLAADGTFSGYGVDLAGLFLIDGTYTVDPKGVIAGAFQIYDEDGILDPEGAGTVSGKADKKGAKMSLKFLIGGETINAKGTRLPAADPLIPGDWIVELSAPEGRVPFELSVTEFLDPNFPSRVYEFEGQSVEAGFTVSGGFFLTGKGAAYGIYEAWEGITLVEEGIFSGKISQDKLNFKLTSSAGDTAAIKGEPAP